MNTLPALGSTGFQPVGLTIEATLSRRHMGWKPMLLRASGTLALPVAVASSQAPPLFSHQNSRKIAPVVFNLSQVNTQFAVFGIMRAIFAGRMPALPGKASRSPIPKTVFRLKPPAFAFLSAFLIFAAFLAAPLAPASPSPSSPPPHEIALYDLRRTLTTPVSDTPAYRDIWDECHAIFTLQGIVNRDAPRLFVDYIVAQSPGQAQRIDIDRYWLDKFRREGQWLDARATTLKTYTTPEALIAAFRPFIHGVVLYDTNVPATSNLASTIAGVEDLIALRYDPRPTSLYTRLVVSPDGPRLPVRVRLLNPDGTSLFTGTGTIPTFASAMPGNAGVPPADEGRPDPRPILPLATCHFAPPPAPAPAPPNATPTSGS